MQQQSNFESGQEWATHFKEINGLSADMVNHFSLQPSRTFKNNHQLLSSHDYVFRQCTSKPPQTQQMFENYRNILIKHLNKYPPLSAVPFPLEFFNNIWLSYHKFTSLISKRIFSYIVNMSSMKNRYYLPGLQGGLSLEKVAVSIIDQTFFGKTEQKKILFNNFVNNLGKTRSTMTISMKGQFIKFSQNLHQISPENDYVELKSVFLNETRAFYAFKFSQKKHLKPCEYYTWVLNLLSFQKVIVQNFFYFDSEEDQKNLKQIFEENLIKPYTELFIQHSEGLFFYIEQNNRDFLFVINQIYSEFEGFTKIKACYYKYTLNKGKAYLQTIKNKSNQIVLFYNFFENQKQIITKYFQKNQELIVSMNNAFESVISGWEKIAQKLMNFCRNIFHSEKQAYSIPIVTMIFEKMSNKDEFIKSYENSLEDLILNNSQHISKQKQFIKFLAKIWGEETCERFERIIGDYLIEKEKTVSLANFGKVTVLAENLWEKKFYFSLTMNFQIISPFYQQWNLFEKNYCDLDNKRKLKLIPLESEVWMSMRLTSGRLLVKMNLLQASIVCLLSQSILSISEISSALNCQKSMVETILEDMKFLEQKQKGFSINWSFISSDSNLDIISKTKQEKGYFRTIQQDRYILVEASIVKIMKKVKETSIEQLIKEVISSITIFKATSDNIKISLEKLQKRDFVEISQQGSISYIE